MTNTRATLIKNKLQDYKNRRAATGKNENFSTDSSIAIQQITVNEELMDRASEISENNELIRQSINDIDITSVSAEFPDIQNIIQESDTLIALTGDLKKGFKEKIVQKMRNTADNIVESANGIRKKIEDASIAEYIQGQSLGGMLTSVSEVFKNALMVTAAGTAYLKANYKLDFHYWLSDALVKRSMLEDHLENLANDEPEKITDDVLDEVQNEIWSSDKFDVKRKKLKNLSVEQYHEMLMMYFEKFGEVDDELTTKELNFVTYHPHINSENILSIISALEKRHVDQKRNKLEQTVSARLLARLKDKNIETDKEKTVRIVNTYANQSDLKNENNDFSKICLATIDENNEHILNEYEMEEGVEEKIQKELKQKAIDKRNALIAKAMLLTAAVLTLTIAVTSIVALTFSVPGLGPVIGGLGVVVIACTIAAYFIKPEIFSNLKNEFSSSMDKMIKHYNLWKKKHDSKHEVKSKQDHSLFKKSEKETNSSDETRKITPKKI